MRWLGRIPPNHDEALAALNRIKYDGHRAVEVFDGLRALFGRVDQEQQPIDMNEIILGVIQSLQGQLKDHRVVLIAELPLIRGHRGQLQEVVFNLINNAIEAMDEMTKRSRVLQVGTELRGRNAIAVAVQDSGPGIDPRNLDKIFGAFVTTKTRGTGLGLAICRMIVERHGGQLTASSDGKSGALFEFVLPIEVTENAVAQF
jgi:signal transduction histidine kinase